MWLMWVILSIFLFLLTGYIVLHHILPYYIVKPYRINIKKDRNLFPRGTTPEDYGLRSKSVNIKTTDGIQLHAYFISASTEVKGSIILLHGIDSSKETSLHLAAFFSKLGFNTIIYDSRAHGKSEGVYCTYGYYEKDDVSSIIDFIEQETNGVGKIGVWGNSMGGAVAILALEKDKRLQFGLIQNTFAEFHEVVYDYMKRTSGVRLKTLSDTVLKRAGVIANFNPSHIQPVAAAKNVHQPVLIIHGKADKKISPSYSERIYKNLTSTRKELLLIDGGGHDNLWEKAGKQLEEAVSLFIKRV